MNKNSFHILVVDDDDRIRDLIRQYLIEKKFLVTTAQNVTEARKRIDLIKFDILILDIMMPGENGLIFAKEIKKNSEIPIILLTAKGKIEERIEGLETGADDYLSKPFSPKELLLRINNILKKVANKIIPSDIKIGEISLNLNKLTVKKNNKISKINPAEKKLLEKMISSSGKIFPRREIGKIINTTKERTVDVMITRLRQKIEPDPKKPKYLQTIRGSGYVLWIE